METNSALRDRPHFDHEYDLVVSFAGEDRLYVDGFVKECKSLGYRVFYDEDEAAAMWGEELTEYFADVYENRSRFAVMFVSEHYARKPWTVHERRSILLRALEQGSTAKGPYLLPVRFDDTPLPGLRRSVAYMDARNKSLKEIVAGVQAKLGSPASETDEAGTAEAFSSLTPRTQEECARVLTERPPHWEYYYTAYLFIEKVRALEDEIRDVQLDFFEPGDFLRDEEVFSTTTREIATLRKIMDSFEKLLLGPAQIEAWGMPGEPGDPRNIEHLAERYQRIISSLLGWTTRVGSFVTESDEAADLMSTLRNYSKQPLAETIKFAEDFRQTVDQIESNLRETGQVKVTLPIVWELADEVTEEYSTKLASFGKYLKRQR